MKKKKNSVQDLYDKIVKNMSAEDALKMLIETNLKLYENKKLEYPVHPMLIISMATIDMGWNFIVTVPEKPNLEGLVIGTDEYIQKYSPKNKMGGM